MMSTQMSFEATNITSQVGPSRAVGTPLATMALLLALSSPADANQSRSWVGSAGPSEEAIQAAVPSTAKKRISIRAGIEDAYQFAQELASNDEIDPPNSHTFAYAASSLGRFTAFLNLPPPLIAPLQGGGVGAEWHDLGLNIELRYRGPYDVYVLIEDARAELPLTRGKKIGFDVIRKALSTLQDRAA